MTSKNNDALEGYQTRSKLTREKFQKASKVELTYWRQLKQVARQINSIVKAYAPEIGQRMTSEQLGSLNTALRTYAEILRPWSRAAAGKMLAQVQQRDERAWATLGRNMGRNLRREIAGAPTGLIMQQRLDEQVELITSLPIEAAERVHKLTMQGITEATRAKEISEEILKTGAVTESRARMIARTEVARTASVLTQARSEFLGATHYIWRTAGDSDVRDSHKKMNGKVVAWDTPPTLSDGTVTHAGQIYNCRCYPEPILPEE